LAASVKAENDPFTAALPTVTAPPAVMSVVTTFVERASSTWLTFCNHAPKEFVFATGEIVTGIYY